MIKENIIRRLILLCVAATLGGAILYMLIFQYASKGVPFMTFSEWCQSSTLMHKEFGDIKSVQLKKLGSYNEMVRGDAGDAKFMVNIVGSRQSSDAVVVMNKENGKWKVLSVNGITLTNNQL